MKTSFYITLQSFVDFGGEYLIRYQEHLLEREKPAY